MGGISRLASSSCSDWSIYTIPFYSLGLAVCLFGIIWVAGRTGLLSASEHRGWPFDSAPPISTLTNSSQVKTSFCFTLRSHQRRTCLDLISRCWEACSLLIRTVRGLHDDGIGRLTAFPNPSPSVFLLPALPFSLFLSLFLFSLLSFDLFHLASLLGLRSLSSHPFPPSWWTRVLLAVLLSNLGSSTFLHGFSTRGGAEVRGMNDFSLQWGRTWLSTCTVVYSIPGHVSLSGEVWFRWDRGTSTSHHEHCYQSKHLNLALPNYEKRTGKYISDMLV